MSKIKKQAKWNDCQYALFPFGFPICSYGVEPKENISIKDFYHCMANGKCRKEFAEAKEKDSINGEKTMSLAGTLQNKGNLKTKVKITQIRENPLNFYENTDVYKKTIDKETGEDIELMSLADGLKEHGQMHNLVVYEDTSIDDGKKYTLISGARRYKASFLNYENGVGSDEIDVLIIKKPENAYEEQLLIIEGNKQRRREFQSKQVAYKEVCAVEQIFDNYKKQGLIPKGQVNKRKFVALSLGISEGTVENLHHKFDKTNADTSEKKQKVSKKKSKAKAIYNIIANEIQSEIAAVCDKVKLTEKEITFRYETVEDLKKLLEKFNINTDISEIENLEQDY